MASFSKRCSNTLYCALSNKWSVSSSLAASLTVGFHPEFYLGDFSICCVSPPTASVPSQITPSILTSPFPKVDVVRTLLNCVHAAFRLFGFWLLQVAVAIIGWFDPVRLTSVLPPRFCSSDQSWDSRRQLVTDSFPKTSLCCQSTTRYVYLGFIVYHAVYLNMPWKTEIHLDLQYLPASACWTRSSPCILDPLNTHTFRTLNTYFLLFAEPGLLQTCQAD